MRPLHVRPIGKWIEDLAKDNSLWPVVLTISEAQAFALTNIKLDDYFSQEFEAPFQCLVNALMRSDPSQRLLALYDKSRHKD